MTGNSIALPLTRRKKWKPPRPQFWIALFAVIVEFALTAIAIYMANTKGLKWLSVMPFRIFWTVYVYNWFKRELEIWRKDNE